MRTMQNIQYIYICTTEDITTPQHCLLHSVNIFVSLKRHQFGTRLKEHQKAVSTLDKGKSALAEHVCYTKHEIAWENSKVITTNNRYGQRLCLEAWHINMSKTE
jgi:hypothetical protein